MRCAWASAQARAHSQKKNGIPNRNRTRTRAQYEARASLWLPTGSELLVEVLGAQGAQGGRRFDLSLAAKRRMRLISWLAFWGSLSNRRCQIAECRARYLKPAAPIPPPHHSQPVSHLLSRRRCRLNRTTTGDIKIMKCAGVVDSLLARPAASLSQLWPGLAGSGLSPARPSLTGDRTVATETSKPKRDVCRLPNRV